MALELPRYEYDAGAGTVTIDFTEPLADDPKFKPRVKARDSLGGSGIRQRNSDFQEEVAELNHEFVPESEIDLVITMMKDHVLEGNTFDFTPDRVAAPGTKFTVEYLDDEFEPDRMFLQRNLWRFRLRIRKEIT